MGNQDSPHRLGSCIVLLCIILIAGCGRLEIVSAWRSGDITIDGVLADWHGYFPTYIDAPNIAIRVLNDDDYVYLCLSSPDGSLATQLVTRGFTVWFDPKGGKEKVLGIRCPLGIHDPLRKREIMTDRSGPKGQIAEMVEASGNEMEVLCLEQDEGARMPALESYGIQVKPAYASGSFLYELRIPLHRSEQHPYAIGCDPDQRVGLGFEMPGVSTDEMRRGTSGGMPPGPGGEAGGEGGGSGGMPPDRGMGGPGRPEGLKIWTRLTLAAADSLLT